MDLKTRIHASTIRRRLLSRNNYPTFVSNLKQLSDEELIEQERLHHESTVHHAKESSAQTV
jgi:hypothetical protein